MQGLRSSSQVITFCTGVTPVPTRILRTVLRQPPPQRTQYYRYVLKNNSNFSSKINYMFCYEHLQNEYFVSNPASNAAKFALFGAEASPCQQTNQPNIRMAGPSRYALAVIASKNSGVILPQDPGCSFVAPQTLQQSTKSRERILDACTPELLRRSAQGSTLACVY